MTYLRIGPLLLHYGVNQFVANCFEPFALTVEDSHRFA